MNKIEDIRNEIKKYFDQNQFAENSQETFISPNGNFRLVTSNYHQTKDEVNWDITKAEIFDNNTTERIFDFYSNDGSFFHSWLEIKNNEYLICAEDLCGGQTVIDLTKREMASFSKNEDGFIWTEFHLSPNGKILAVIGCYWACPFVIKIYDFKNPLKLPLAEIMEFELINDEKILCWLDNNSIKTTRTKQNQIEEQVKTCLTQNNAMIERVITIKN